VGRLQVVERVRLQALLDELELAQSDYVDSSTAPRVGRLLGAGRIVGGTYLVADDEELRLQVTLVDAATGEQVPQLENQRASLDELFDLQTRVTFSIVDQLGVELTAQERAAIEEVPTQSIQAFLAYSRGLREEDRGNYDLAAQYYQEAQQIDPNFEQARERQRKARSVESGGGSAQQALANESEEALAEGGEGVDLVRYRQESMGAVVPIWLGQEEVENTERDPAQESETAEEATTLDDPPKPPGTDS
jgi:tetratricopeptide (TPR) repeat protein